MKHYRYFNRDISWLSFNYSVLQEAKDQTLPLYERIKFLAIYSNNMEEFYRVRVSYYRTLMRELSPMSKKIKKVGPEKILQDINNIVNKQQEEFMLLFQNEILPGLREKNIILVNESDQMQEEQLNYIKSIFKHEILPYLQPVLLFKKKVRPFLKTGHIYLILEMYSKNINKLGKTKRPKYGLVKIPTDHNIPRFIELPEYEGKYYIMFLEDVIRRHVNKIFPGYTIDSWYTIKVTRDADLSYDDYDREGLIETIENISNRREVGKPNRFQYDREIPPRLLKYLLSTFYIAASDLVKAGKHPNFRDFFNFPNPLSPELENERIVSLKVAKLDAERSFTKYLKKNDFLLHYPYQSFDYFLEFLREVIRDKRVTEIKTTQYRLATNSAIVEQLVNAALGGKKVTVFVELKARFDEEANLRYAKKMKKAGINIIYSIPKLKVHAKAFLVIRKSKKEKYLSDYVYLSTGNFNERTARQYVDHGLFTSDKKIVQDIKNLFNFLETQDPEIQFEHILVPGFNLIDSFKAYIDNEIYHAQNNRKAYICLKMNGLQHKEMIDKLYEASNAGVKIDLILRGICCLVPGEKFSKNIRVIRIVDRFLEHSRIFWFYNNGENDIYLGSADWMNRNLERRIECVFPIYDDAIKKEIIDYLKIQLSDNTKARIIDNKLNAKMIEGGEKKIRSQMRMYEYLHVKNKTFKEARSESKKVKG